MPVARLRSAVQAVSPARLATASFAAGAGMMLLFAMVAPVIAKGGLTVREADAQTMVRVVPLIDPLDLDAIKADLAAADRAMAASQYATDAAVARLQSLAGE